MTLPRFASLSAYWQEHPPIHIIGAAWAGVKSGKEKGNKARTPDFALLPEVEDGAK